MIWGPGRDTSSTLYVGTVEVRSYAPLSTVSDPEMLIRQLHPDERQVDGDPLVVSKIF